MKTNSYLWSMLAAATFTLAGCGSEENGITEPMPQGKTAQLELRLTGSGVSTKATGSALPTQNEENAVKRFTVAIFNSDESVNAIQTVTNNTTSATTINCTPATNCTGIVVANAPTDGYFSGVLNKTDFLKRTIELADAQTKDCLPMSGDVKNGDGNATFTLGAGINTGMTARLSRLVARVSVSGIRTEFDTTFSCSMTASYELTEKVGLFLTGRRDFANGAERQSSVDSTCEVGANYLLNQFVTFTTSFAYINSDYIAIDRNDDEYVGRVGVSYKPNKFLTLGANYRFLENCSNVASARYNQHLVDISVAVKY